MNGTMKGPVVVLEADRWLGRAVVQAAVDQRRPVIAVASDPIALKELKGSHPHADLTLVRGSIEDATSAAALANALRALDRPLAGIVTARCSEPPRGRVLDQSTTTLRALLDAELLPQFAAARELIPVLAHSGRGGSYVVIGGPGGESPWAGYGQRSISAAALRMMIRVLHDEARALPVRVQLLAVEMPARTDENHEHACSHWPTAVAIGERALSLIDPTDAREPAQAVVRYAWNAAPPLPSRAETPRSLAPSRSPPTRGHDDTWALLKPLLSSNNQSKGRNP